METTTTAKPTANPATTTATGGKKAKNKGGAQTLPEVVPAVSAPAVDKKEETMTTAASVPSATAAPVKKETAAPAAPATTTTTAAAPAAASASLFSLEGVKEKVGAVKETVKDTAATLLTWETWAPYLNLPVTRSFEAEIQKAVYSCGNMAKSIEANVLRELIKSSDGLAFLTVAKGGVVVTGQFGSGLVLLKDPKTGAWSAPAAVATAGGGMGPQGGWDVTDVVLFFKTATATEAFKGDYQVAAGVSGGVALGPFGRAGSWQYHVRLGSKKLALAYSFNWSKGFFLGTSVDVKGLAALPPRNKAVYGDNVTTEAILSGKVTPPAAAKPLYQALDKFVAGTAE